MTTNLTFSFPVAAKIWTFSMQRQSFKRPIRENEPRS
jgi:hypothetical protein